MGKYGRPESNGQRPRANHGAGRGSRVGKPAAVANDQKKVLSKFDARLKLLQKKNATDVARAFGQTKSSRYILDARELLNRKKKGERKAETRKGIRHDYDAAMREREDEDESVSEEEEPRASSEPVVIVTGLGNIRKKGDRLQVVQNRAGSSAFFKEHQVLSNGANTIVTLSNDLAKSRKGPAPSDEEEDEDIEHEAPITSLKNLVPIKIRVENDLSRSERPDFMRFPIRPMQADLFYHQQQEPLRPSSARLQPGYPLPAEHLNAGRLGHYYPERPVRPAEYGMAPAASRGYPPQPYHDLDQAMDFEESYQNEPVRPPVLKSTVAARSSRSHTASSNENGFRVVVSNLHPNVSQEDILELFSDVGPIKRAKFVEKGVAEVIYVNLDDAYAAIKKYDQKELDYRPMRIELTSNNAPVKPPVAPVEAPVPVSTKLASTIEKPAAKTVTSSSNMASNTLSNRFKAYPINANVEKVPLPEVSKKSRNPIKVNEVDSSIIQQVLFNKKPANSSPVTFTVKL